MNLSPDGGATPAARREGDRDAQYAAYRSGMVFRGKLDIPVIDWRHYLEHRLDMHHAHQSFATRQRLLNYDGDASNQIIWFTDARPGTPQFDQTPQAFLVLDQWIENIKAHPERSVAENKPADAVDACFATNGSLLAKRRRSLERDPRRPPARCLHERLPAQLELADRLRRPDRGKRLQVPAAAGQAGDFGAGSTARGSQRTPRSRACRQIFPTGVCDYSKPDAGLPPELRRRDHDH